MDGCELSSGLILKVKAAHREDIRSLVVRVSAVNVAKINNYANYSDGMPVLIERKNTGKKTYAIIHGELSPNEELSEYILMDDWTRKKLCVEINDEVIIKRVRPLFVAQFSLFWGTMVFNHPDLTQRGGNFGLFLAIGALLVDFCSRIASLDLPVFWRAMSMIGLLLILAIVPPLLLVPKK